MLKETGELMSTIEPKSVQPNYAVVSSEPGFKTLCSYNWQDDGSIFVPGGPPKWTPPILPVRLPQDTGQQFIDQNAYRVPRYPFEPAFQAMAIMNPSVRLNDVDIIANRNSLRKLLDFAAGKGQDPFCMGLHMINDTLVISRKERCARHMIHGAANSGYGHNFEKAFTAPDEGMDNSSSHHRVIRYHIGSMDCVVRFEVDAYYEDPDDTDMAQLTSDPVGALTSSMTDLAVTNQSSTAPTPKGATKAVRKGNFIHPSKLAEIKARKAERLNDAMPQLWFGRTPYFMVGKHNNGVVNSVSITHAASIFAAWEKENDDRLRKLVSVLAELKSIVKGTAKGAAILVYEKGGGLKAFEMKKDTGVLPKDIIGRHWDVAGDVKLK
ncbi:hypothetical protein EJ02DRAFT_348267 [Clathrospora elynae]|uniref:Geranylgeranyl pyrophosphate synthetase n=1 Tax=Clathrospora elynae TaxID=706981 RepID=A0A6A5SM68_9PLEO|nr:hypothetical protein EJ02DRAFT_348267 [Clathrospora elynae]